MQYWTTFAKTGDPNGPGLPPWPRYDVPGRRYLELSQQGPLARAALRRAACVLYLQKLNRELDARRH
jgi:para-nitrobenzyl esterase